MTLFLHEEHDLLHLVVNSIRKDLLDHNELFNCLALHAIANIGGREMGEALSGEVHRLLISPYVSLHIQILTEPLLKCSKHLKILCQKESGFNTAPTVSKASRHCAAAVGRADNFSYGRPRHGSCSVCDVLGNGAGARQS